MQSSRVFRGIFVILADLPKSTCITRKVLELAFFDHLQIVKLQEDKLGDGEVGAFLGNTSTTTYDQIQHKKFVFWNFND